MRAVFAFASAGRGKVDILSSVLSVRTAVVHFAPQSKEKLRGRRIKVVFVEEGRSRTCPLFTMIVADGTRIGRGVTFHGEQLREPKTAAAWRAHGFEPLLMPRKVSRRDTPCGRRFTNCLFHTTAQKRDALRRAMKRRRSTAEWSVCRISSARQTWHTFTRRAAPLPSRVRACHHPITAPH